jgi:serine/threonine protein kinase/tetratricopeptide (TPR) repeat protein
MGIEHEDIDAILCAAIELTSPADRQAYIERACGDDPAKRTRVEQLLAAHFRAGGFLESPAPGLTVVTKNLAASQIGVEPGSMIGPFRILEQIGEGGIGVVFLAEQTRPVQRRVALKVIKLGMDTRQVIARFEAERQALAIMNHPNVAKIFDAGTTDAGKPYFVMELVEGVPVTEYCDQNSLTIERRLELFIQVCRALEHAHQKGLIHRDIKPGNVLVCNEDARPCAKVIDFGIAKATQQQSAEKTMFTETHQLIGTPQYMSPEQAEGSLDIDTRTDVYSLGVLLYELLTGTTPFEGSELRSKAYSEMQRIIREVDPLKPSTRLSKLQQLPSVAALRSTEPRHLGATVRGELDWIVMKSLEKDPRRRYQSANGLGQDVQRYLDREAVLAVPPSRVYRFSKFVRRNKGPVTAAATIVVLLVAGIVGTTVGLIGERRARQRAIVAAAAEKTAKETAEARDAESRAVLDFVQNRVFAAARPQGQEGGLGRDVTLRKAVEAALPYVERSFKNQPLVEARLRMTFGTSFWFLGDAKTAAEQFEAARALAAQHLGPDHHSTLACMTNLATMYEDLGRYSDALKLRQETLAIQRAKLGPDDLATLKSMSNLANSYNDLGRNEDALSLREEALPILKAKLGPDHALTITGMNNLALSYSNVGREADALKLREETLAVMRSKFGAEYPELVPVMNGLATSYAEVGREGDALKLREETLALAKVKLGVDHPMTLWAMNNLAISYQTFGRQTEALALREEVLARRRVLLGPDHPDVLDAMNNLAISYQKFGREAEALALREDALTRRRALLGPEHPLTLDSMHNLAYSYAAVGRHEDALKLREEVLAERKSKLGADHPETLRSMRSLAETYQALGRDDEALQLRQTTLAMRESKLGPAHPDTLRSMKDVAESLIRLDRSADALGMLDVCLKRAGGAVSDPAFITDVQEMRRTATTHPTTTRSTHE